MARVDRIGEYNGESGSVRYANAMFMLEKGEDIADAIQELNTAVVLLEDELVSTKEDKLKRELLKKLNEEYHKLLVYRGGVSPAKCIDRIQEIKDQLEAIVKQA